MKKFLPLILLTVLCAFGSASIASCAWAQREAPISTASGEKLYVDPVTNKPTTQSKNPDGSERARATLPVSSGNVEGAIDFGRGLGGALPPPFGLIVEGIGAAALTATALAMRAARRKRLEEYGLTEEMIIEDDALRAKVEARASHEVKARLAGKKKPA